MITVRTNGTSYLQKIINNNTLIKDLFPNNKDFTYKDIFGKDISETRYKELDIKEVTIRPKLKGGSVNLGFVNSNGIPSGMKNLHKYKDVADIINNNHISTFLETGCAISEKPKLFSSEQKISVNNPA